MKERAAIVKELGQRLSELGMVALAVSFATDDGKELLMALGSMDRLASMSAGILDRTQNNLFTYMQVNSSRYDTLLRDAYGPSASMSVSVCVDGEWKRMMTAEDLCVALSV